MKSALAIAILLASTRFAAAAGVELSATLSTNTIRVGDRVTLTLIATHDAAERIILPPLNREPYIMVWNSATQEREVDENRRQTQWDLVFSSFIPGEHRVGEQPLLRLKVGEDDQPLAFPELVLRVQSVLTNPPPALADLKPPATLPRTHPWLRTAAILLGVTLLALIAALILRRYLRQPRTAPPAVRLPPHEVAFSALQALEQRGYLERNEPGPFYVELSAIIRIYLEDRFDLHAPEQTTEEFIRASSKSDALSLDHQTLTRAFLEQSDLVKFARFTPGTDDMRAALDSARRLVHETVPSPTTPGGAA